MATRQTAAAVNDAKLIARRWRAAHDRLTRSRLAAVVVGAAALALPSPTLAGSLLVSTPYDARVEQTYLLEVTGEADRATNVYLGRAAGSVCPATPGETMTLPGSGAFVPAGPVSVTFSDRREAAGGVTYCAYLADTSISFADATTSATLFVRAVQASVVVSSGDDPVAGAAFGFGVAGSSELVRRLFVGVTTAAMCPPAVRDVIQLPGSGRSVGPGNFYVAFSDSQPVAGRYRYCAYLAADSGGLINAAGGFAFDVRAAPTPTPEPRATVAPPAPRTPKPTPVPPPVRTSKNTRVLCLPPGTDDGRVARRKPTSCTTLGTSDAFANAANLARLRWRGWGALRATATGIERGFHLPLERVKVRVTLTRPRLNDCDGYSYTRLLVVSRYGKLNQKLPAVCDETE